MRKIGRALPIIMLVMQSFFSACGMERAIKLEDTMQARHSQCFTCHRTNEPISGETQPFADGLDPSSACLDCHQYRLNHHPVDVVPGSGYENRDAGTLPLFDGQVRCLTCHKAHADPGKAEFSEPPKLLRGGPYEDRRALCFACHEQKNVAGVNPHKMLAYDNSIREINGKPICMICHARNPVLEDDPMDMQYNADIAFMCWRCHSPMQGGFLDRHFHVVPRKITRMVIRKTEKDRDINLPLARDGMMTCSTCHNPHQEGVLTATAAAAGADAQFRLRVDRETICRACHLQ